MSKILVADDEQSICSAFSEFLRLEGHTPLIASNGEEVLKIVEHEHPDAVFLDVRMPGMDGLAALNALASRHPEIPVIIMTAYGTMQTAMDAMRQGAFDYLGKPVELEQVRSLLARALHRADSAAHEPLPQVADLETEMVGQAPAMQEIFKLMGLLTSNDLTVLITGESGVGKELAARGIHFNSPRKQQPFMAVNCSAVPENLLESELFGHERGAFTGADVRRIGRFEAAGDGTVFLDEIGEVPLHLQGKLLRVLQERSFERVGSVTPLPVRARIITATNRNLEDDVAEKRFREDLYYRLKLVTLDILPLRRRREDIEPLALKFLALGNRDLGREIQGIEPAALERLRTCSWPGNVRELEHAIKRALLTARGPLLAIHDLQLNEASPAAVQDGRDPLGPLRASLHQTLNQLVSEKRRDKVGEESIFHRLVTFTEQELVAEALRITGGNQVSASQLLGLHRTTLRKKRRPAPED